MPGNEFHEPHKTNTQRPKEVHASKCHMQTKRVGSKISFVLCTYNNRYTSSVKTKSKSLQRQPGRSVKSINTRRTKECHMYVYKYRGSKDWESSEITGLSQNPAYYSLPEGFLQNPLPLNLLHISFSISNTSMVGDLSGHEPVETVRTSKMSSSKRFGCNNPILSL